MNKLLVILGPTGTGKTDLALSLVKKFNGELVSCDSRQVYTNLDIGTGKYPNLNIKYNKLPLAEQISNIKKARKYWEIDGMSKAPADAVKIWMYDVISPKIQYTVAHYVRDAGRVIREIRKTGKLPIVVGGTGLYLKALLEGLPNLAVPVDKKLRKQLEKLALKELQQKLQLVSIKRWKKMNRSDRANPRRLIRAIELSTVSIIGRSPRSLSLARDDILKIGLTAPREVLYRRVDEGVVSRINQGMIDEARKLHKNGLSLKRMKQMGLEYGVLSDYLSRKIITNNEPIRVMQNKIHGFVRRQITWFKKERGMYWFDITKRGYISKVENMVAKWYHP